MNKVRDLWHLLQEDVIIVQSEWQMWFCADFVCYKSKGHRLLIFSTYLLTGKKTTDLFALKFDICYVSILWVEALWPLLTFVDLGHLMVWGQSKGRSFQHLVAAHSVRGCASWYMVSYVPKQGFSRFSVPSAYYSSKPIIMCTFWWHVYKPAMYTCM